MAPTYHNVGSSDSPDQGPRDANLESVVVNLAQPPTSNTGVNLPDLELHAINSGKNVEDAVYRVDPEATLFHSGIDYQTVTTRSEIDATRLELGAFRVAKELEQQGFILKPWSWKGYDGFSVGVLSYGRRHDSAILRASSIAAPSAYEIASKCADVNVTRLDLQVTVQYLADDLERGRRIARAALLGSVGRSRVGGRPFGVAIRDTFGRGDTVEIGSRSSESYGRVYDKYREAYKKEGDRALQLQQFQPGCWRFEIEYKGSQAGQMFERMLVGADAVEQVAGWYREHGVELPVEASVAPAVRSLRHVSDIEHKLAWLRRGVAPTVLECISRVGLEKVIEALRLPD